MKRLGIILIAWCAASVLLAFGWSRVSVSAPDCGTDAGWSDYRAAKAMRLR